MSVSINNTCFVQCLKFPSQIMQPAVWRFNTFKFQPMHYAGCELNMFFYKLN